MTSKNQKWVHISSQVIGLKLAGVLDKHACSILVRRLALTTVIYLMNTKVSKDFETAWKRAYQDDSSDTPQPICEFQVKLLFTMD